MLFGALTVIPLFLLTAALFDRRTGLWAAAFWAFGVNAITYNRIGKEDTLMVFFLLFAFYFFLRARQVRHSGKVPRAQIPQPECYQLWLDDGGQVLPPLSRAEHALSSQLSYVRERNPGEPGFSTPLSFFILIGITFLDSEPG